MKYNFSDIPSTLNRRGITLKAEDGSVKSFGAEFGARLAAYFQTEPAASAVTYPVTLHFEDLPDAYDGRITITRAGELITQLNH